jgi:hypothetical protein
MLLIRFQLVEKRLELGRFCLGGVATVLADAKLLLILEVLEERAFFLCQRHFHSPLS